MSLPLTNSSPTIAEFNVRSVIVPMVIPHRTASGVINESPLVLIDVTTSDGVIGHGLLFAYTPIALSALAEFLRHLRPLIVGQRLAPQTLSQQLNERFRLLGTQGIVGMALAGIDMAVWDALARTQDMSLVALLGGSERPIPAYGAVGFDGVTGSAEQAQQWVERGLSGIKAKIGYPTVAEDLAVVKAMREAAGPEVAIMVDYNQSLLPADAIARTRVLDGEGLTWVEEPTSSHDFQGHATIARQTQTPIQCGENWWGVLDVQHALQANAADYFMLDVMKIGGVTGWMKAAAMAEAANIAISSHLWSETSARLLSCSATANWLEYCDWWSPILQNPLRLENGLAQADSAPGSGLEWNEVAVQQCLV